jgi:ATP-dependent exoDNAse (exonuclease V) alpha subunit
LDKIASSEWIVRRINRTKVLIIDEISMLSAETFSMVDIVCREIKQCDEPFGGIQVVLVGDFFQLPPIVKNESENDLQIELLEKNNPLYAYESESWQRAKLFVCYLTEQHRQDDDNFIDVLSAIRSNTFCGKHMKHIEARKVKDEKVDDDIPKLFSHNIDVNDVNDAMLQRIGGSQVNFAMISDGNEFLVSILKKGCLSPENLCLKTGASVMFTKNNPKKGFVNGTLGTVSAFDGIGKMPIVRTKSGKIIQVEPMEWAIEENGKIKARINQLPLRLAWAVTVHKSQGMSLDEAVMDLSDAFEFGQGYVALSRVKRLSGLHLLGWNERTFQVSPSVLKKDKEFREFSLKAGEAFAKIQSAELVKMQENFVTACGGKNISKRTKADSSKKEKGEGKYSVEKIREKFPNAYRSWSEAEDEKLEKLFKKGEEVKDLVKIFGRKSGAVRSRLVKLGLIEDKKAKYFSNKAKTAKK